MITRGFTQLCCLALGILAAAQLPWGAAPVRHVGVSKSCEAALNSEVACPLMLRSFTELPELLDSNQLDVLCTTKCAESLRSASATIRAACSVPDDIVVEGTTAYPASHMVDKYALTVAKSCLKDPTTGEYCHTLFRAWSTTDTWSQDHECSQCTLDLIRTNLESPLQYTEAAAQEYVETGLRCGKQLAPIDRPPSYALNASASGSLVVAKPVEPVACDRKYFVESGDNCVSIAKLQRVSTLGLIEANNLDSSCSPLPPVGGILCLPKTCRVYIVQHGDSCFDIALRYAGVSSLHLKAWNPVIDEKCANIADLVGTAICVSKPGEPLPITEDIRSHKKLVRPDINAPAGSRERKLAMELIVKERLASGTSENVDKLPKLSDEEAQQMWQSGPFMRNCAAVSEDGLVYLRPTAQPAGCTGRH